MNGQRYRETPLDIERLRRLNRATVERYMAMKGAERLQRHSLFVEDGCAGNWTTESGEPLVFRGHESLRRLAEWLERCFPDWEWHNVRIFETEDPNHFWVECDGRGKALVPGYPQGYCENHSGSPIVIRGKDKLAEHAVWSLKCFPDWEWYNINIFGTDDPNHFWVECDGHGKILFPGYPEGYYENHFLHSFELEDGKIKRNREFMNVFQQLRALSIPVPEIKREGIPT